jgi:hypothetical protein
MAIIPAKAARAKVQEAYRAGIEANLPAARNEFARILEQAAAEGRMKALLQYRAAELSPTPEVASGQLDELLVTMAQEMEELGYQVADSKTQIRQVRPGQVSLDIALTVEY